MSLIPDFELHDVSFAYNDEEVLREVHLTIEHGDFLAVIGPNGGGKTTLLKIMLGLLKPARGTVRVFGTEPRHAVMRLGYVPQDTSLNRDFPIRVNDVVLMGRLGHPGVFRRYSPTDHAKVRQALETVGMWDYRGRRIGALSGGQRQRVYIARALASDPDALLLDEPTASIDVEGQRRIYEILKGLNDRMTVVVVSHDLNLLLGYARSVAHVSTTLHIHREPILSTEKLVQLNGMSGGHFCPVELLSPDLKQSQSSGG